MTTHITSQIVFQYWPEYASTTDVLGQLGRLTMQSSAHAWYICAGMGRGRERGHQGRTVGVRRDWREE